VPSRLCADDDFGADRLALCDISLRKAGVNTTIRQTRQIHQTQATRTQDRQALAGRPASQQGLGLGKHHGMRAIGRA
jgi:hypothetical protein